MVAILFITSNFIISEMQYDCYSAKYFSGAFFTNYSYYFAYGEGKKYSNNGELRNEPRFGFIM